MMCFLSRSSQVHFDSENWTIWESLLNPSKGNWPFSVYCTMKMIRDVLTTHSLLMSTKHLIVAGTCPKWTSGTFSSPSLTLMFVLQVGAMKSQRRRPQSPEWNLMEQTSLGIRGPGGPLSKLKTHLSVGLSSVCLTADFNHFCQ